ncbi:dihydrodipicolinate synthase family protein [Nonomuraea sp. MG754425]|uniref:dihydrodipicolinate synthase family protein n=1 Tax=Nonomuraea sp. MG754425 TaxID=2570319 RepID=UPI001F202DA4|nr:dihydrodipicolinate synthase family protein [Nonomuraea sp. MG754425]MCF6473053.1 dihydrodipicolinate synthase family protein [Nonomuraea sp. MG754425]
MPTEIRVLTRTLNDIAAVTVTPFDADGAVDLDANAKLVRRLIDAGVRVITPNGNTGEFYALTPDERRQVLESTAAAAGDDATVLAGVGLDVPSAVESARHAGEHGARMVMVHQPVHPYVAAEGWVDYHRRIAEAVPDLGVVPYVRDPRITGAQVARLGEACPNVVGVKYAVPDPVRFASVARDAGLDRFAWLCGLAEPYTPAYWAVGARGFTSGLVTAVPGLTLRMRDALRAGDYAAAMEVWELIRRFEELRGADSSADNVAVVKEALAQLGLCRGDVRPPSRALPASVRDEVASILATWQEGAA